MIAVFLIGAFGILLLSSMYFGRKWARALSVRVCFCEPHLYAGESGELTEIIENRKKQAVPIVEIGFRVPRGLQFENAENIQESDFVYKRDLFAIAGMERIVRRYTVKAQKRGYYSVSQLTCHAPSFLFDATYMMDRETQEEETGMLVYAAGADCSVLLREVEVILGERESARRLYEDPFSFASIRQYTLQDPMKTINWKASARTGELMVNTYASAAAVRIGIFLDVGVDEGDPYSPDRREIAISYAASLIRILVRRHQEVSLTVNYPEAKRRGMAADAGDSTGFAYFASCSGGERLTAVEEYLTEDFAQKKVIPFEEILPKSGPAGRGAMQMDALYIFFTALDKPALRRRIHEMLGQEKTGILAVAADLSRPLRRHNEQNLRIMQIG